MLPVRSGILLLGPEAAQIIEKEYTRMSHRKYLALTVVMAIGLLALTGYWQSSSAAPAGQTSLWRDIQPGSVAARGQRDIVPSNYRFLALNEAALAGTLAQAPREFA